MTIAEKTAYLKGLADGLKIDDSTSEGKVLLAVIDVLKDIACELEDIDETLDDMAEIVSDIEESVYELEDDVFGDDYDDYDFEDEDDLYEITCGKCGNALSVDTSALEDGSINCPNCGEKIEFEIDIIEPED